MLQNAHFSGLSFFHRLMNVFQFHKSDQNFAVYIYTLDQMSFSVLISYYTTSTPYSCILPQCSVCGTPSLGQHTDPRSRSLLLQYHICGMIYLSEQLRDIRYPLVEACFTGHILSFLRYSSMIRRDSSVLNSAAHRQQSTVQNSTALHRLFIIVTMHWSFH